MASAGAPARADLIINSFEPSGTAYTSWKTALTTCSVSPTCAATGPCATLYEVTDALIAKEGSAFGQVWLEEDSGQDCTYTGSCDALHPVTIQTFSPKDWSTGFLKVAISGRLQQSGAQVDMGMKIFDTVGGIAFVEPVTMSSPGTWYDAQATLGYLESQGLNLSKIDRVSIIFSGVSGCTSVLVDSLRLSVGMLPCTPNTVSAMPGNAQVTLNWIYPTPCGSTYPVAQYCVYRATYAIPVPLPPLLPTSMTRICGVPNPFTDTGVVNDTTYFYKVTAVDTNANESPPGDALPEQDRATPTCGGTPPAVSAASWLSGIRVMWTPVGGASQYNLYRSTFSGSCATRGPLLISKPFPDVYHDDLTTVLGQKYCYTVTAVTGGCETTCSNQACDTYTAVGAPPCSPPGPILSLTAISMQTQTMLAWTPAAAGDMPVSYYQVYRGNGPGPFTTKVLAGKVFETGLPVYSFTVTGEPPVTQFCWQIRAVAENSCTNFSTEQCSTTGCILSPPFGLSSVAWCDRVRISWTGVPANDYRIYRGAVGAACGGLQIDLMPGVSVYYDDVNGLVNGTTYAYVVTAENPTCESACSAEVSATYLGVPPCAPTPPCTPPGMIGTPTGTTGTAHVTVTWPRPIIGGSPLDRYFLWLGVGSTGSLAGKVVSSTVLDTAVPEYTTTVSGLSVGTDYCAIVEVIDAGGCTNFSSEACFATVCVPPAPAGPVNVAARPPDSLLVSWAPPPAGEVPTSRYLVFRSTVSGGALTGVGTVWEAGALDLSFTNSGRALTQEWCYQVMTIDQQSCASMSLPYCRTCTPPNPVGPISLSGLPPNRIVLGWSRSLPGDTPVDKYLVFRSDTGGYCWATVYDDGFTTSYGFTNTVTGGGPVPTAWTTASNWDYGILTVDAGGCSAMSGALHYICNPPQWGVARDGNSNVTAAQVNSTNVLVSWDAALPGDTMTRAVTWNPVSRYYVFRSTGASCFFQQVSGTIWDDQVSPSFSLTVTGLDPATTYSFEIMAVSGNGCATIAVDCSGAGTAGACSFPVQPRAVALTGPTGTPAVGLQWEGSSTPTQDGYDILRGAAPTGGPSGKTLVASVGASTSSWTDWAVEPGLTYYYVLQLKASGPPPCAVYSSEVGATLPVLRLSVYPNPAEPSKGPVRFDGLVLGSIVEIYSLNGEMVRNSGPVTRSLWLWDGKNDNGTQVAPGIYLWIVRNMGALTRGKIVVGK